MVIGTVAASPASPPTISAVVNLISRLDMGIWMSS
jgi:hypothetical protein